MGGKPRVRRTAAKARELILEAAESQLSRFGPDSLRLKQLAADVGMSHPAILHHFGTRDGLVRAVVERTARRMEAQVFQTLKHGVDEGRAVSLLGQLFEALADEGHARLLVWLFLTRRHGNDPIGYGSRLRHIADTIHQMRCARLSEEPDADDTLFTVLLAGLALFGNAIAGRALRESAGLGSDADADKRFVAWLAKLLHDHLDA